MTKQRTCVGLAAALSTLLIGGCGTLIGNAKPVAERSQLYHVEDLTKTSADWLKLESRPHDEDASESPDDKTEYSDIAYKSKSTDAVIALNSACRPSYARTGQNLELFTQQLLMGLSEAKDYRQETTTVDGVPALQTTVKGYLAGAHVKMRVIDLRKDKCVYDLMYLSHPKKFALHEEEFHHFVSSLRLQ